MTLRIEQGKGRRDRYAMLSPVLLERLRTWWRVAHAQGKMLEGGWLFPGLNPIESLSTRQLNRAVHAAAQAAEIDKRVSMHTLRHSFATHLLEQKVMRSMPRSPPICCARWSAPSRICIPTRKSRRRAQRARGRGYLPPPQAGLATDCLLEPWAVAGHVGHRTVPYRGAGRACAALFRLRQP